MMQVDLFAPPARAAQARRTRAEASRDHAIAKAPDPWVTTTARVLASWARGRGPFMAEDFRLANLCSRPPEPRHWGAVVKYAQAQGWIRAIGYAPANSSNRSPKVKWVAA